MNFRENHNVDSYSFEFIYQNSPLIIMVPHSGRNYDKILLNQTQLSIRELRDSEDAFVDQFFSNNVEKFSFLKAKFPRIFVDVNRSPLEIDPLMWQENGLSKIFNQKTLKVLSGTGVFPKVNLNGDFLYKSKIPFIEAKRRLFKYYFPYHKKIKDVINSTSIKFKRVLALDCHSMSSDIIDSDIVLSNGEGITASYDILYSIKDFFKSFGFKVSINNPFKGGFISYYHSNIKKNIHFIQVEVNKNIYMSEQNYTIKKEEMKKLQSCFKDLVELLL